MVLDMPFAAANTPGKKNQPGLLCLTFQRARLFLLPTLRLRLGFAIYLSINQPKSFLTKCFQTSWIYYTIIKKGESKEAKVTDFPACIFSQLRLRRKK